MKWQIGDVKITKRVEIEMAQAITWILPDATEENLAALPWLVPHFAEASGRARMSVHALVIESPGRRLLVDTCVGNDKSLKLPGWGKRQGTFLRDLEADGFAPESIDTVLCTHLHVDHVGWNTRLDGGKWVPTFPRARYLWSRAEWEHWNANPGQGYGDVMGESIRPVFDAGLVDLVDGDHVVSDEIRLEPTPGHTPGHVSVHVTSRGEEAVITGDLMHHPSQCAHPEWGSSADVDPRAALATRRAFLERYADRPVLILGTHFAGPTAGRIVRDGDVYRFDA